MKTYKRPILTSNHVILEPVHAMNSGSIICDQTSTKWNYTEGGNGACLTCANKVPTYYKNGKQHYKCLGEDGK